jgi:hypothetical protein
MISIERLWREAKALAGIAESRPGLRAPAGRSARSGSNFCRARPISMGKLKAMLERRRATREHLRRRADNGSNMRWNIVLACQHCNSSRGDRTPEEHRHAANHSRRDLRMKPMEEQAIPYRSAPGRMAKMNWKKPWWNSFDRTAR